MHRTRPFILAAVLAFGVVLPVSGQQSAAPSAEDTKAILAPIDQLFAGMKARDTTMIRDAFVPIGRLIQMRDRNGETVVQGITPAQFAAGLLRAPAGDLVERYWGTQIQMEDDVANVWVQYDFHHGGKFSHCGIDAVQLSKTHAGWKIVQIMDTSRTTGCTAPPA
jgi:hypothetical protein